MENEEHVTISLTVSEAIALNNFSMEFVDKPETLSNAALKRAAKKLLARLNEVSPPYRGKTKA